MIQSLKIYPNGRKHLIVLYLLENLEDEDDIILHYEKVLAEFSTR